MHVRVPSVLVSPGPLSLYQMQVNLAALGHVDVFVEHEVQRSMELLDAKRQAEQRAGDESPRVSHSSCFHQLAAGHGRPDAAHQPAPTSTTSCLRYSRTRTPTQEMHRCREGERGNDLYPGD